MFTKNELSEQLLDEIRQLKTEVVGLRGERDAMREEISLADRVKELKKQIADLEVDRSRLEEKHQREKREVEHMVGLEKKRQSFEIEQARRETEIKVREENLTADRQRFTEQLDFHEGRFKEEVSYLKDLMTEILKRLPNINVDRGGDDG